MADHKPTVTSRVGLLLVGVGLGSAVVCVWMAAAVKASFWSELPVYPTPSEISPWSAGDVLALVGAVFLAASCMAAVLLRRRFGLSGRKTTVAVAMAVLLVAFVALIVWRMVLPPLSTAMGLDV